MMANGMIDITEVVKAVIALAAVCVSVFLIPWIKANTTEKQRGELLAWVEIGVAAAEQLIVGSGKGAEKLQYVLDFLNEKGFDVNVAEVRAAIEAAVQRLNQFEVIGEAVSIGSGETE